MHGVVYAGIGSKSVKRQVRHVLVARVQLKSEVLVAVKRTKMRAPRSEFGLGEPELTNGQNASEFEPVLPNAIIQVAAVVTTTANSAPRHHALRDEMKRT